MDQATMVLRAFILKNALPVIGGSLRDLFNKSLFTGKFPEEWKLVHIAPINKSGARGRITSQCQFIFSYLDYVRSYSIISFMNTWTQMKSLYKHQFGFKLVHSIATALIASTND